MIPYGAHEITEADIRAVVETLRSAKITQGSTVDDFENGLRDYCGAREAVAVSHGTAALHLACKGLGVGPGDVVWTSPVTFVASANCARYCGADVDFVDIEPDTFNLSTEALAEKLAHARRSGQRLPKAVVAVHFAGQSCDMVEINRLAAEFGFRVIEDACHALGGQYQAAPVGGCRYSDAAVFSFHPVKAITCGEGGAITTNDPALADAVRRLRNHGITRDAERMAKAPHGPWYYEQVELGYNYRLSELHAALGLSQLERLEQYVSRRNELALVYRRALSREAVQPQARITDAVSAHHLYVVRVPAEQRSRLVEHLKCKGIEANVHYIPLHLQPYFERLGFRRGDFPAAEAYYDEALTLPLFPGLTGEEQRRVIDAVEEVV